MTHFSPQYRDPILFFRFLQRNRILVGEIVNRVEAWPAAEKAVLIRGLLR